MIKSEMNDCAYLLIVSQTLLFNALYTYQFAVTVEHMTRRLHNMCGFTVVIKNYKNLKTKMGVEGFFSFFSNDCILLIPSCHTML